MADAATRCYADLSHQNRLDGRTGWFRNAPLKVLGRYEVIMSDRKMLAEQFRSLHRPGRPLVIFNIWDAGSAKAVAAAGASAIGLGSWSVAAAHGYEDGERVPLSFVFDNLARIVEATELPVSIDFESGYGRLPAEVGRNISRIIDIGAVGCNLEDSFPENGELRAQADHVQRIAQVRKAAETAGLPFFINARTDCFMLQPASNHDLALLKHALERGRAYADAGADGLFIPGLVEPGLIERAVTGSALPVNIMVSANSPSLVELAELGVARVSHGPGPYRAMMKQLESTCRAALARETGP